MTAEWYNNSTGKDPEDYKWFIDYKNRLSNPFNGKIEDNYIKSVDLIKVYWDNSYFIKNLLEKDILLKTSVAVNKFKSQYSLLYAASLVYLKDDLELTLGHSHQVSYFERGNISKIFQDRIDKRKSKSYSATTKFNFDNEFLDYLILESYFKEYKTNEYGKAYGMNFLLNKDDKFSYRLSSSIGKSEFKNLPLIRSVDKTLTILTSYEITDSWTTFLKFGIQDGYWTDKSISGRPEKLGTSKSIDVGMIKTFDVINKGDVSIAAGAYFPLKSPLFTYLDSKNKPNITYAPTTFTLQLTVNY